MSSSPRKQAPQPDDPDDGHLPPTRPSSMFSGRLMWIIFLLLLVWNIATLFGPANGSSVSLAYSDFLGQVRQGTVATVNFSGQNINGTFAAPVAWPPASPAPSPGASAAAASPPASAATPTTYTTFTTIVPPNGDPALLPLLEAHGVTITAQDTGGGSFLFDLLISVGPVLLLIGVLVYMGRRMQRSQQGIFGFGSSKARVFDVETSKITFADVAGEDEAKIELAEVVDFLKSPERYRRLGARLPRGVLLIGPPGTGKTLLARAVAGEAGAPFFSISASEFVEMFVGVGASRVRDLFGKAKAVAPAIVFVDEIDAVGRQRGTGMGGGNDEREQTLNQLLVEMDGFDDKTNVIVMAATNRPDVLDPALLRPGRFDRQVTIGYPDRAGREAILRIHTSEIPLDPSVDLAALARATTGFAGADLANLANEAALQAARDGRDAVGSAQFEEALERIMLGTKQAALADPEERRVVAVPRGRARDRGPPHRRGRPGAEGDDRTPRQGAGRHRAAARRGPPQLPPGLPHRPLDHDAGRPGRRGPRLRTADHRGRE